LNTKPIKGKILNQIFDENVIISAAAAGQKAFSDNITTANGAISEQNKVLEEITAGSLKDLEKQLSALNDKISGTSPEDRLFSSLINDSNILEERIAALREKIRQLKEGIPEPTATVSVTRTSVATVEPEPFDFRTKADDIEDAINRMKIKFKELGSVIRENVAAAFGELAFNMGQAIANGEDLGTVLKNFIASMITQVGKMVGMALIGMAMPPTPFPLSLGFLVAGLAVLGLSGLLSGLLTKDKKAPKGGGFTAPGGANAQAPSAATGLSSFEGGDFGQPVIQTIIQVDGQNLAKAVNKANANIDQRRNG